MVLRTHSGYDGHARSNRIFLQSRSELIWPQARCKLLSVVATGLICGDCLVAGCFFNGEPENSKTRSTLWQCVCHRIYVDLCPNTIGLRPKPRERSYD